MKQIFEAVADLVNLYLTVIKPGCETVMEHPIFRIFAIPAAIITAIKLIQYILHRFED